VIDAARSAVFLLTRGEINNLISLPLRNNLRQRHLHIPFPELTGYLKMAALIILNHPPTLIILTILKRVFQDRILVPRAAMRIHTAEMVTTAVVHLTLSNKHQLQHPALLPNIRLTLSRDKLESSILRFLGEMDITHLELLPIINLVPRETPTTIAVSSIRIPSKQQLLQQPPLVVQQLASWELWIRTLLMRSGIILLVVAAVLDTTAAVMGETVTNEDRSDELKS
jgi:hypothetical protein